MTSPDPDTLFDLPSQPKRFQIKTPPVTTLVPFDPPFELTDDEYRRFIAGAYAQHLIDGAITVKKVALRANLPEHTVGRLFLHEPTIKLLEGRGITFQPLAALTQKQDALLLVLGDPHDGLNQQQKLRKAGVSNTEYQAWLRNPIFRQHVDSIVEQLHNSNAEAMIQLARKAGEGDLSAIKFLFEMNGKYNPRAQQALDVMVVMSKVLESISRHVKDPNILEAIATDIKQIAASTGLMPKD